MKTVSVNGRDYRWPRVPAVVICCDGSEPAYMEEAMARGLMPRLKAMIARGENRRGLSVIPSFTNPNNLSIVTGRPPAVHGICGNYLIDPASGRETMMNDPKWLRAPTIFEAFQKAGAKVLLLGMQVPPNYGSGYTRQFEQLFAKVAQEQKVPLVPFLLAGIGDAADSAQWFQADRIHPNEAAQPRLLANVWPTLQKQLP